jgi:hypothetical protein
MSIIDFQTRFCGFPAQTAAESIRLLPWEEAAMLIRFKFSNFRSFRGEQELSMVAASRGGAGTEERFDLVRVAAIYGANGAGKSNALAALRFLREAVRDSHHLWGRDGGVPREPFLLDAEGDRSPSLFEIDFLLGGVRFRYGFGVDSRQILFERLDAWPAGRRQLWFSRQAPEEGGFQFGKSLKGNNRVIAALARPNSLFLSVAAENNHAMLSPVWSWIAGQLRFAGSEDQAARTSLTVRLLDSRRAAILDLVRLADLGVVDLDLRQAASPVRPLHGRELPAAQEVREPGSAAEPSALPPIEVRHAASGGTSGVVLPLEKESRGTVAWLALAGPLLQVVESGAVLCADELGASLHPRLVREVIRLFADPGRNPHGAQLIFNSHDTTFLGNLLGDPLRRDQVWLVEKDGAGVTNLYPLTDFKPRKDENRQHGYLQGRYGGIPFIADRVQCGHAEEA